jgi:sugar phosphate isomerase/epimerase
MKLAVSNIGWSADADATIAGRLAEAGAEAIEVAPGRIFEDLARARGADAARAADLWAECGLPVVSMQALLFGQPDLRLFGDLADRRVLLAHLRHVMTLAGELGCGPLVFGSPRNRLKGDRSFAQARDAAVGIFRDIGDIAAGTGTVFCLEANARAYGCDFMTVLDEAIEVVAAVDHPAVRLVVDTGNMALEGEAPGVAAAAVPFAAHFHMSAPQLAPIAAHAAFIGAVLSELRRGGYDGVATVEMRAGEGPAADDALLASVRAARAIIDGAAT